MCEYAQEYKYRSGTPVFWRFASIICSEMCERQIGRWNKAMFTSIEMRNAFLSYFSYMIFF